MIDKITGQDLKIFRILKGYKTRDDFAKWSGRSLSTIHPYESLSELTDSARFFYETKLGWDIRGMKKQISNLNLSGDSLEEKLNKLAELESLTNQI